MKLLFFNILLIILFINTIAIPINIKNKGKMKLI